MKMTMQLLAALVFTLNYNLCKYITLCDSVVDSNRLYTDFGIEQGLYFSGIGDTWKMNVKIGLELWGIMDMVSSTDSPILPIGVCFMSAEFYCVWSGIIFVYVYNSLC